MSIENVQSKIDKLVLTIFEAVVPKAVIPIEEGTETNTKDVIKTESGSNPDVVVNRDKILAAYNDALSEIDALEGIDDSEEEQIHKINLIQEQFQLKKTTVLELEKNVNEKYDILTQELITHTDKEIKSLERGDEI